MNNQLKQLRKEIDAIDKELAALCALRIRWSQKILKTKRHLKLKSKDLSREKVILAKFNRKLAGLSTQKRTRAFVKSLLSLNAKYPKAQNK